MVKVAKFTEFSMKLMVPLQEPAQKAFHGIVPRLVTSQLPMHNHLSMQEDSGIIIPMEQPGGQRAISMSLNVKKLNFSRLLDANQWIGAGGNNLEACDESGTCPCNVLMDVSEVVILNGTSYMSN
jgi:hypothetical protein